MQPAVGDTERVSIIEITPKYVTVSVQTPSPAQSTVVVRKIFGAFIDPQLRSQLRVELEAVIVYERFARGIAYFLRPLPADAPARAPLYVLTAADLMARAGVQS